MYWVRLNCVFNKVSQPECCMDVLDANSTCPVTNQCSPGCYREWNEDGSSSCIKCKNETISVASTYNLTDCRNTGTRGMNFQMNISTVTPFLQNIGGPEVAASLILGTFFISLFLILSVASFFYLKRANKLPNVFYRRNKDCWHLKLKRPQTDRYMWFEQTHPLGGGSINGDSLCPSKEERIENDKIQVGSDEKQSNEMADS
uniref:Chromosome 1 open reading frame 159 n=1 Tax=Chelonoidis abingdonii TaxID=106734 RepID=A0A8C0JCN9_CHEAB